jgi:hypothetical protein
MAAVLRDALVDFNEGVERPACRMASLKLRPEFRCSVLVVVGTVVILLIVHSTSSTST